MAERSIVDFIEDWQTGFFIVIGSVIAGVVSGVIAGSIVGRAGFAVGFTGGAILGFLAYSYLRYGR